MIVHGSHTGYRTTTEAMEVATAPFFLSLSLANAVHEHSRNSRDDQLKACAAGAAGRGRGLSRVRLETDSL